MTKYEEALKIMDERFGHDCLISVATIDGKRPAVRIVNSYYEDGSFYTVTYALSNKMKQIIKNSEVAICGEWFTAHGIGENIGHPRDEKILGCRIVKEAYDAYFGQDLLGDMHTAACYIRLWQYCDETGMVDVIDLTALKERLREQVQHSITKNTAEWKTSYICKPSQFFNTRSSVRAIRKLSKIDNILLKWFK